MMTVMVTLVIITHMLLMLLMMMKAETMREGWALGIRPLIVTIGPRDEEKD